MLCKNHLNKNVASFFLLQVSPGDAIINLVNRVARSHSSRSLRKLHVFREEVSSDLAISVIVSILCICANTVSA